MQLQLCKYDSAVTAVHAKFKKKTYNNIKTTEQKFSDINGHANKTIATVTSRIVHISGQIWTVLV
jgi:hypothetical protein